MQNPGYYYQPQQPPEHHKPRPKRKKRSRLKRFVRGYLMFVGALTTLYVLIQLLVLLLVEIGKYAPVQSLF